MSRNLNKIQNDGFLHFHYVIRARKHHQVNNAILVFHYEFCDGGNRDDDDDRYFDYHADYEVDDWVLYHASNYCCGYS